VGEGYGYSQNQQSGRKEQFGRLARGEPSVFQKKAREKKPSNAL
jgi:hypothetical protein